VDSCLIKEEGDTNDNIQCSHENIQYNIQLYSTGKSLHEKRGQLPGFITSSNDGLLHFKYVINYHMRYYNIVQNGSFTTSIVCIVNNALDAVLVFNQKVYVLI